MSTDMPGDEARGIVGSEGLSLGFEFRVTIVFLIMGFAGLLHSPCSSWVAYGFGDSMVQRSRT